MFHEVWQLERFRPANVTIEVNRSFKGIGTGFNRTKEIKQRLIEVCQCAALQHLSEKMRFSYLCVLRGSAEALVRIGGKIKHIMIMYFLINMSAKNYHNWFMCAKIIASQNLTTVA